MLLELASRSYELFIGSEPEEKREIIGLTLQNLFLNEGKLEYTLQKPFDSIFVEANRLNWSEKRDSNPRPLPWEGSILPLNYSHIHSRQAESNC